MSRNRCVWLGELGGGCCQGGAQDGKIVATLNDRRQLAGAVHDYKENAASRWGCEICSIRGTERQRARTVMQIVKNSDVERLQVRGLLIRWDLTLP